MKKTVVLCLGILMFAVPAAAETIVGSAHDLSHKGMNETRLCVFCHTPHFAREGGGSEADMNNYYPLWNREDSLAAYEMYESHTAQYVDLATTSSVPTGPSKLCLSCHDGTIAVDAYSGLDGTVTVDDGTWDTINISANLDESLGDDSVNLKNDHPISFDYEDVRTAEASTYTDGISELRAVTETAPNSDIPVAALLYDGRVECTSCHDVHNKTGLPNLLTVDDTDGSKLCLTCHDK